MMKYHRNMMYMYNMEIIYDDMEGDGKVKDMEKEVGRNYSKDYMVEL